MKTHLLMTIAIFSRLLAGVPAYAQAAAAPPARLDPDMVSFLAGHWKGEGEFAGGVKIAADVDFSVTLDSAWLLYEHRDQAPHTYKATSMWGVTEPCEGYERGGAKLRRSSGKTGQFKMTYEVSQDGLTWRRTNKQPR